MGGSMKEVKIIEAASENGAGKRGASLGPAAVFLSARQAKNSMFEKRPWLEVQHFNDEFTSLEQVTPWAKNIESIIKSQENLAKAVETVLNEDYFPLILSGDHSNAIGTVSGLKNYYPQENIGVIWVDAHYDLHSPYTSPSGNVHGMALNALLDKDNLENKARTVAQDTENFWEQLKRVGDHKICPKIQPQHIVFIGARDFEEQEIALVEKYKIKCFTPEYIKKNGIDSVLQETLDYLSACEVLYVSFDVDSQDTTISLGTGTPVEDGLLLNEADKVFSTFFPHPKVKAFEITEINPLLDAENKMAATVVHLLDKVL